MLKQIKTPGDKRKFKKKINIIEDKLKKTHKKIGKGVKKTEKGAVNLAKKVGDT